MSRDLPQRSHSGFASERELQTLLADQSEQLFALPNKTLVVGREVHASACIPDLVCVRLGKNSPTANTFSRRWTFFHAHVVRSLLTGEMTMTSLSRALYIPEPKLRVVVDELTSSGLVRFGQDGMLRVKSRRFWSSTDLVAVEAKLERWKEAIDQALSYRCFAERVAIAIPESTYLDNPHEILDRTRRCGVGLCIARPNESRWVVRPRKESAFLTGQRECVLASVLTRFSYTPMASR